MRIARIIAGIMLLAGIVWMLQGSGAIGGTPMSGRGNWLVIGVITALVGYVVLHWTNMKRYSRR